MGPPLSFVFTSSLLFAIARAQFFCTLTVPANPLTAEGLATPYEMTGCNQLDFANQGCFVEANIFDPVTGAFQVYNPLVINAGMTPVGATTVNSTGSYIPPVVPTVPVGAVVAIWFGSNANTVTLAGATTGCVNGLGDSVFGQFAYCNAPAWFTAASAAVVSGLVTMPPPGVGTTSGQACPTTRDFRIVDQDQSDNVDTTYLLINGTILAQNSPANAAANPGAEELTNASDNALVNGAIDPALGCTPVTSPCATCPNGLSSSLATNELQGSFFPPAGGPALVPLNDDFAYINANGVITQSLDKTNLYRAGVGQPLALDNVNASGTTYCQQFAQSGLFIALNQQLFSGQGSPAANQATNLYTFMAMRFSMSFSPVPFLGCTTIFGVANPVDLTLDGNGIVTAATINTVILQQIFNGTIAPVGSTSLSLPVSTPVSTLPVATSVLSAVPVPTGVIAGPTAKRPGDFRALPASENGRMRKMRRSAFT